MNKLKIGLLLILSGIFINGFSQLNDFDLSKYKLPELERRSLETNFNISGHNYYTERQNPISNANMFSSYYNGDIYLEYNHYLNSSEFQRKTNLGVDFSSDFRNRKDDKELLDKDSYISPLVYFQRDSRKYYNGLSFIETDLVIDYQYGNDKRFLKNTSDDSERNKNIQTHKILASAPLKFGSGRIEQVQDARHAIYLFDELSKIDRVTASKSDEQIIEFAELISKLKNKRFFDSRLRRMEEIERVDSFLISKNYVSEQDAKYFTTLSDFWDYGNRPFRNKGTRFSGAILPGYYYYDHNYSGDEFSFTDSGKYSVSAILFDGGIELKHEKPINLFWQNSVDLNCYAGIIEGKLTDKEVSTENKIRIPNIRLGYYQTIGFYPNTRTDITFGYSVQYIQLFGKTDVQNEILGAEGKGLKAATYLSIRYYISPKFRLNFASSFYYMWQESTDETIINFNNVAGSNYLPGNFTSITNGNLDSFMENKISNSFIISLIYSIF